MKHDTVTDSSETKTPLKIHPDFNEEIELPPLGNLPGHRHVFDAAGTWAIRGALGARRALLVRGEPGTGKSELARAAAVHLGRPLSSVVVTSGMESQDLLWRFDAVSRLAQAQVLRARDDDQPPLDQLKETRFLQPGPLWWVIDWQGAEEQWQRCVVKPPRPQAPAGWTPRDGCVLLIDEIDKAEPDLPNGLLESLGNGQFQVPYLQEPVRVDLVASPPLVIITTNEERELPPAFVRRCLVLRLEVPENESALREWLRERGHAHFGDSCPPKLHEDAAGEVLKGRGTADDGLEVRPGLAEYLDLLRAVLDIAPDDGDRQAEALANLSRFVREKRAPGGR